MAGETFLVLSAEHIPVPADCSRFVWGLRPDLDQRPGRGEEEEWGEPGAGQGRASGGPGHTQWHSSPQLHSGCQVEKWIRGCQSIYFSRDSRNLDVFVPSLCLATPADIFAAHVGELWSRGRRAQPLPWGPANGCESGFPSPTWLACEPCPYAATLSLLYPYILSRSAPSHV